MVFTKTIPMKNITERSLIVVLGMHRSGTSAMAGLLSKAGISFGRNLMPPHRDNPKGYFEDNAILNINDAILTAIRSSWYDITPLKFSPEKIKSKKARLMRYVKKQIKRSPILGVKDPRIIRLLPVWLPIIKSLRITPRFIIVVRDVREVCRSLNKRNHMSCLYASVLWALENLRCERYTRGLDRIFINYDDLIKNPFACMNKIKDRLGLPLELSAKNRRNIYSFINASLNRSRSAADEDGLEISPSIIELSRFLEHVTTAGRPVSHSISRKLDEHAEKIMAGRDYKIAAHYHGIFEQQHTPRLKKRVIKRRKPFGAGLAKKLSRIFAGS